MIFPLLTCFSSPQADIDVYIPTSSLRVHEIDTDSKYRDPISGGAASTLAIMTDFTMSLGGLFIDPYKSYKMSAAGGTSSASAAGSATVAVGGGFAKMTEVLVKGTIPYDDLKAKIAKTGKEVRSRARAECHLGLGGSSDGPDHLWRNGCVEAQQQT